MAKRILVAVDRTTPPAALLELVSDAARGGGATVRLLHVAPVPEVVVDDDGRVLAYSDQELARVEAEALDALRTFELHFTGDVVDSVVRFGDSAREILREADAFGADLIVLPATCPAGLRPVLFGGLAEKVARRAPMAVAAVLPAS